MKILTIQILFVTKQLLVQHSSGTVHIVVVSRKLSMLNCSKVKNEVCCQEINVNESNVSKPWIGHLYQIQSSH